MNTPIAAFTDGYADRDIIRAHMPGHKGKFGYALDITEIKGADSLFEASGIIKDSEKNASGIFGSFKTLYSAGGSTLCIQTMLALITAGGSKKVIAARNCHRAFLSACALLDIDVEWLYPEYESSMVSGKITAEAVENAIRAAGSPDCVYITSPDYLGVMADIRSIAGVCHKHGVKLAVDNAHGAYLRFIYDENGIPMHPLFNGADICCDSAHKTLPVLTGGAYLHIARKGIEKYEGQAKEIMSMFGSSSPSYLILRSLDMCNEFMEKDGERYFNEMRTASEEIKARLSPFWTIEETECGKLTIFAPDGGLTGTELGERLRMNGVECEYCDMTHTVLMLTGLSAKEIVDIAEAAEKIRQPRMRIDVPIFTGFAPPGKKLSIREAAFAESENIPVCNAAGRICAKAVSCCPPGIAIVAGGEIFSDESIKILKNYSIFNVNVVK